MNHHIQETSDDRAKDDNEGENQGWRQLEHRGDPNQKALSFSAQAATEATRHNKRSNGFSEEVCRVRRTSCFAG